MSQIVGLSIAYLKCTDNLKVDNPEVLRYIDRYMFSIELISVIYLYRNGIGVVYRYDIILLLLCFEIRYPR